MRIDVGDAEVDFERVRLATDACSASLRRCCSRRKSLCKTEIARSYKNGLVLDMEVR